MYLKSTDPNLEYEVRQAAKAVFDYDLNAVFEHGQWWVNEPISGRTWSVVDAEGNADDICDGFGFELIDDGDEEIWFELLDGNSP